MNRQIAEPNLAATMLRRARLNPRRTALVFEGEKTSYAEFADRVRRKTGLSFVDSFIAKDEDLTRGFAVTVAAASAKRSPLDLSAAGRLPRAPAVRLAISTALAGSSPFSVSAWAYSRSLNGALTVRGISSCADRRSTGHARRPGKWPC